MITLKRILAILISFVPALAYSGEFAIMNQTITLTSTNNGFYFIYDTDKGPVNWVSPDNYRDGTVYFRFEMVSMPTTSPSYFSFDIWGDYDATAKTYSESAAPISPALTHNGAVVTFSSSPKNWYNHPVHGAVNWSNRNTFWRWGICHWFSKSPNYLLAPKNWSNSPESWDAWTHKEDWLPVTIKVIIVAVSEGSSFSGWSNYTSGGGGGTKPVTPSYGIDYSAETTNKVVPSTDEYSYSSNMSGAVSGTGQKLSLTPGQDVYFRTKASGGNPASDIQHLDVPSRPSIPAITINFANEVTSAIESTMEYSLNSNMSSAVTGTGAGVNVTPGTNIYIRKKPTSSQFKSNVQTLNIPDRPVVPAITINYPGEVTSTISSSMEYSVNSSMASAVTGNNAGVPVTPGTNLYIRERATSSQFRSGIQTLVVPSRPAAPSVSLDYINEKTSSVASTIEYSTHNDFSGSLSGNNTEIDVVPGTDLYFRYKATASKFSSVVKVLDIPSRPAKPQIGINFSQEKTSSYITSDLEYDDNAEMSSPSTGTGVYLKVTPGTKLYFRKKADVSHFSSDIQELAVPARPAAPVFHVDYLNETTAEIVTSGHQYSLNANMSGLLNGTGSTLDVTPGTGLYFRTNYTDNSFISEIFHLDVPARPQIVSSVGETFSSPSFTATLVFESDTAGLGKNGLEYVNADISQDGLDLVVKPEAEGLVVLKIKPNAILAGNFASEELSTNYQLGTSTGEISRLSDLVKVYPNPVRSGQPAKLSIEGSILPVIIRISDVHGTVMRELNINTSSIDLPCNELQPGIYFVNIKDNQGRSIVKKLIIK